MRVLHILGSDKFSGAENVACQIISMFAGDSDVEMEYCSRDGQIREALKSRGVNFYPMTELSVKELKRVIGEAKPDLLHAHDMRATFIAIRAAGKKIPVVSHIHGNSEQSHGINLKTLAYKYAAKRAKHIIWVSESSLLGYRFASMLKNKSTVLGNVISVEEVKNKARSDYNNYKYDVVFVGRMVYEKNPLRFLKILDIMIKKEPSLRACMLGDGYLMKDVLAEIDKLNLSGKVEIKGFVENPMKIMECSKVMLISSISEGLPMCALEAMALGVPIVSTPTDGLNCIIENDFNGFLSDCDITLAEKAMMLISDNAARKRLSQNAVCRAEKINDSEGYKKKIREIYGI